MLIEYIAAGRRQYIARLSNISPAVKLLPILTPHRVSPWFGCQMHANNVRSLCVDPRNLPTLLGLGLIGSTAVLLSWVGLQNIPLADAQTVFSLYPAATALMAFLILGERLGGLQVVGVLASVAGVVIIAQPPILLGERFAWEVGRGFTIMCLVAAALMSATSITIIRKLGNTEHSLVTSMWFHLTALSICVPALAVGWPKVSTPPFVPFRMRATLTMPC
jgi:drug/metabolite transporter (DMT)-like permease